MKDILSSDECSKEKISRRSLLKGTGTLSAGLALLSVVGCSDGGDPTVDATTTDTTTPDTTTPDSGTMRMADKGLPWAYEQLDPDAVAAAAYENWYEGFCCYAIVSSIANALIEKQGTNSPWVDYPLEASRWGHGGAVGWGTLCGTLTGAGIITGFFNDPTNETTYGEHMLNDIIAWYSSEELPVFDPGEADSKGGYTSITNTSESPLCHVSVGKWMEKADVAFFSSERKDRCARVAASVAYKTVELLNKLLADGTYETTNSWQASSNKITSQKNCTDCHSTSIPSVPGT